MKDKLIENKKSPIIPDWKESEFAQTIDGQVMLMIDAAIKNESLIEAQSLSWSIIEELLIPRLIAWIVKNHKINLPNKIYELNIYHINLIYLTLSHDFDLFQKLEKARKNRNKITHALTRLGNINSIKRIAKESVKANILLQEEITKRFTGKVPIPSLNLYQRGWNDCRSKTLKNLGVLRKKVD